MNKVAILLILLMLCAAAPAAFSQETAAPEAAAQETPPSLPARRPKLPGEIVFESSLGNVVFPHKVHQRMGCQKCHHQIHAKDLVTPHDEYLTYSWVNCRDCHDESQNHSAYFGCAKCHHSNLANIADETLNAKVVVHKSCWKCHLSGTGVQASERCGFCHVKEQPALELSQEEATAAAAQGAAGPGADGGQE